MFTNMKQKDRVLKAHTKTATILLYVSGALQTHNGSRVPIDLQNDTEDYEEGAGEGGGPLLLNMSGATLPNFNRSGDI